MAMTLCKGNTGKILFRLRTVVWRGTIQFTGRRGIGCGTVRRFRRLRPERRSLVSRRVRRLEDAMRTELFSAVHTPSTTEEGRIYFEALSDLPGQVRRAEGLLLS